MASTTKSVLKYTLLPGLFSRTVSLLSSGFYYVAYLIAVIFNSVKLLPDSHPYLLSENIGKFGLRHAIGEAANHLRFSLKNIDQIIVFFTILSGLLLLAVQLIILLLILIAGGSAIAQTSGSVNNLTVSDFFVVADTSQDIAMILMDRIFGIPGMFNSCISLADTACENLDGQPITTTSDTFPWAIHTALRALLAFYANGVFFIGVMIILYFVTVIIGETAVHGSPFGQRYNKTWVPVRIILFFALLIPFSAGTYQGLNAAQLITFWSAKWGSHFATNAWIDFNEEITGQTVTGTYDLIAEPNVPATELEQALQFMFLAKTCKIAEEIVRRTDYGTDGIQPYLVRTKPLFGPTVEGEDALLFKETDFSDALGHTNNSRIRITIGARITDENHPNYDLHELQPGNVRPICGSIALDIKTPGYEGSAPYNVQEAYYDILLELWNDPITTQYSECLVTRHMQQIANPNPACTQYPDGTFVTDRINEFRVELKDVVNTYLAEAVAEGSQWVIEETLIEKGWAGAAIWYNRIAELNGAVTAAILNLPVIEKYPYLLEYVAEKKRQEEEEISEATMFDPQISATRMVPFNKPEDAEITPVIYKAFQIWNIDANYNSTDNVGENPFVDAINFVFGTEGVFDIMNNPDVNPLAQLSALGRGMMEASIRNILGGVTASLTAKTFENVFGKMAEVGGAFFQTVGYAAIAISFTLYYILPIMPFVYFFFAIGGWVKSIFEATVAMPLWALAHISRWDGNGVAGPGATNGYFLIFEIFARPIMILFGLFASISIFSAMVMVLNEIFSLAINNVGGFTNDGANVESFTDILQGPVDELFYTAVYTIVCYMIGLSAFKLIDQIPNEILRWMGFTVKAFQETTQNAAEELSQKAYKGSTITSNKLAGTSLDGSSLAVLTA